MGAVTRSVQPEAGSGRDRVHAVDPQETAIAPSFTDTDTGALADIPAGWPEHTQDGCVRLDPALVLRATPRSFALRVWGQSMAGAGIYDGDIVVGEFSPEARPGAIVVALIDGESVLKRLTLHRGRAYLAADNPNWPALVPLSELVIQGVVHTVVHRVT